MGEIAAERHRQAYEALVEKLSQSSRPERRRILQRLKALKRKRPRWVSPQVRFTGEPQFRRDRRDGYLERARAPYVGEGVLGLP